MSPREHFRITVFLQIIDSILAAMQKRLIAYSGVRDKFSFLHNIVDLPDSCLREACSKLVRAYSADLEPSLSEEMIQFKYFLNSSTQDGTFHARVKKKGANYCTEVQYYSVASSPGVCETFPNVNVAFRIYLTLMVANCSGERSFSALGRVKNAIRTTMNDERLNFLTLMTIESDLVRDWTLPTSSTILPKLKFEK